MSDSEKEFRSDLFRKPRFRKARDLLLAEFDQAVDSRHHSVWDYAVSWRTLRESRATKPWLKALLAAGYLEHRIETTPPKAERVTFRPARPGEWSVRSGFVLTPEGATGAAQARDGAAAAPGPGGAEEKPIWRERQFWYRGRMWKAFGRTARAQEPILDEFQKRGWPRRVRDPLERIFGHHSKSRLLDVIKTLNRGPIGRAVRFHVEADGKHITWAPVR
jgi:hypothetical protein